MPEIKPDVEAFAKIKVVGVGGGGNSVANRMIQSRIRGVDFISINTDVQALHYSQAPTKLHIGKATTRGLGAGMNPDLGFRSAEESQNEIREVLKGADMVFLTAGMGGGTGSGALPKVAEIAKELGALTIAVITKPFSFEGAQRMKIADESIDKVEENVDTIITIPNDRVLQIVDKKTSLLDAFTIVDDVLRQGVQGITEVITVPGLINLDYADVRSVMETAGSALMGIGNASGDNRAVDAAKMAISSPLLDMSIDGAKGVLFTVSGGASLGMHEVSEAAEAITASADADARIIFGAVIDETLKDEVKVTVIATGFDKRLKPLGAPQAATKTIYEPNKAVQAKEKEEKTKASETKKEPVEQERKFPFTKKAASSEPVQPAEKAPADDEQEDLEIPAFIRKKMM